MDTSALSFRIITLWNEISVLKRLNDEVKLINEWNMEKFHNGFLSFRIAVTESIRDKDFEFSDEYHKMFKAELLKNISNSLNNLSIEVIRR